VKAFKISVSKDNIILKQIPKEELIFWPVIFSFVLFLGSVLLTVFKFASLPQKIPLFYSKPWGQERLAGKEFIWLLPSILLLLIIANTVLAKIFVSRINFLAQMVAVSLSILSILTFFTLLRIIILVS
jgi:hypothetical protein